MALAKAADEGVSVCEKKVIETPSTTSPSSPTVCLLLTEPLSPDDYIMNFADGDLPEIYRNICCRDPSSFRGSWQLLLGGRSDSVESMLAALGIGLLKRKVMASFASVTDIQPAEPPKTPDSSSEGGQCPTFQLTTHLPLKNTKQGIFCFDGSCSDLQDGDTGYWQTRCVWLNGRALQRRWGPLGVMWDTRCVFEKDPCTESPVQGAVMLFQWTFEPVGKPPIKCMRWLKKL